MDFEDLVDSGEARIYQGDWETSGRSFAIEGNRRVALIESPEKDDEDDGAPRPTELLPKVSEILKHLTPKQRFVIERRWGLIDGTSYSQAEIAASMGVTPQAVAKIETTAWRRLTALAVKEHTCENCGGPMHGKRADAKTCSEKCRKALQRKAA